MHGVKRCAAAMIIALAMATASSSLLAQRGRGDQAGAPPSRPTPRASAPVDLAGTWVSIVTEDWRWRMVTPPRGDVAGVPVTAESRKVAQSWDLAADNAAGTQCKAFGVGGIMRQPGRLRVSWQDDETLKLEFDAGTQTRLLWFDRAKATGAEKTWQGYSIAEWEVPPPAGRLGGAGPGPTIVGVPGGGGIGLRGAPPPRGVASINSGGNLKVVTTGFREGYLRKNGVPYSDAAVITEYIHRLPPHPNGDNWLQVITIVEDAKYLTQPFYTSTNFRLEPSDATFTPSPCRTDAPIAIKK